MWSVPGRQSWCRTPPPMQTRPGGIPRPRSRTTVRLFPAARDVRLHRAQHSEQLVLLVRADLALVQRAGEILDDGIEVVRGDLHPLMGGLHVLARVLDLATRCLA